MENNYSNTGLPVVPLVQRAEVVSTKRRPRKSRKRLYLSKMAVPMIGKPPLTQPNPIGSATTAINPTKIMDPYYGNQPSRFGVWIAWLTLAILISTTFALENINLPLATFQIIDEAKPGFIIGNVPQLLWPQSSIAFSLIVVTSSRFQRFNEFFFISKNGSLSVQKQIDRDNVNDICGPLDCCQAPACVVEARMMLIVDRSTAQTGPPHDRIQANLRIRITDINDNPPIFPLNSKGKPEFTIRLQEGGKFSTESLPAAIDLDGEGNGVAQYTIVSQKGVDGLKSDLFKLNYEKVLVNPTNYTQGWRLTSPSLTQLHELDYEKPEDRSFEVIIIAIDGGTPALTGSLSVTVELVDINDNTPVFDQHNTTTIELAENSTYSADPIYKFHATDLDSKENALITYSLSPLNEARVLGKFSIDQMTGNLFLTSILDYELYSERQYSVVVVASDNGTPKRSGTTTLTVLTKDINDNIPSLVVQENITIIEGVNYTKPVLRFYVKDDDSVSRGKVVCRPSTYRGKDPDLVAGAASLRLHEVTSNAYFVFMNGAFDYEETRRASIELICIDNAGDNPNQPQEIPIRITVAIGDANDHYPEFGASEVLTKIEEHAPRGTKIIKLTATDADSGIFSRITYSLVNSSAARCNAIEAFSIDSQTGVVTVKEGTCLDREAGDEIHVFAAAEDGGGLSMSVKLKIQLIDINDNAPVFEGPEAMSIRENLPSGTVIGRIKCSDSDLGVNSIIHLQLSENNTKEVLMSFDLIPYKGSVQKHIHSSFTTGGQVSGKREVTALLITKRPLDRESMETYTIHLVSTDMGAPSLKSQKSIYLTVLDDNDNQPTPRFPPPGTTIGYHPQIHTNSLYGSEVAVLRVNDPDKGENGTVVFELQQHSNGSKYFQLDRDTGRLTTAWRRSYPYSGIYAISIIIHDMGEGSFKVPWEFFVHVSPRNPNLDHSSAIRSSTLYGKNETKMTVSPSTRLTRITSLLVIFAIIIVLTLTISCACMIKYLIRPKTKSNQMTVDVKDRTVDSTPYAPSNPGMIYGQPPLLGDSLPTDTFKYHFASPEQDTNWCLPSFEYLNHTEIPIVNTEMGSADSAGRNGCYYSLSATRNNTLPRNGYSQIWSE